MTKCYGCKHFGPSYFSGLRRRQAEHQGRMHRWVTRESHQLGVHWDSCLVKGCHTAAHNAVMALYARLLRLLRYSVRQAEIPVGRNRPNNPKSKPQKIDAVAHNFLSVRHGGALGLDATIGGALLPSKLKRAARRTHHVTETLAKRKYDAKGAACERRRFVFVTVALDSYGAIGEHAAKHHQRGLRWARPAGHLRAGAVGAHPLQA
eukprot:5727968-Prymnesium_polylepis.2